MNGWLGQMLYYSSRLQLYTSFFNFKVGPDRYYARFGHVKPQDWAEANRHCQQLSDIMAQLAVPHSSDDALFMKSQLVVEKAFWVGKLYVAK